MQVLGLEEIDTYISRHQNTFAQYILTWTILDLFLESEQRSGLKVPNIWWGQEVLDLAGLREAGEGGEETFGGLEGTVGY